MDLTLPPVATLSVVKEPTEGCVLPPPGGHGILVRIERSTTAKSEQGTLDLPATKANQLPSNWRSTMISVEQHSRWKHPGACGLDPPNQPPPHQPGTVLLDLPSARFGGEE